MHIGGRFQRTDTCRGRHGKVGIVEFGLMSATSS